MFGNNRRNQVVGAARGFLEEFRSFAVKGNALELAVAVVVGGAFGRIISSLVSDIITPLLAILSGGAEFKNLSVVLREAVGEEPAVVLTYGVFLQHIFDFLIIALSIFLVFKILSNARKRLFAHEEAKEIPPHEKSAQERLLEEIRDLLQRRN
jgi:large conductance mechanosensitive channel